MARYEYVAVDRAGRRVTGELFGDSVEWAVARIRESGQVPAQVRLVDSAVAVREARHSGAARSFHWPGRVSTQEISILSRQIASLVRGGLPVVDAFSALVGQAANPAVREALSAVRTEVESGSALSQALARHPRVYSSLFVSMVRAGEASGELAKVLEWLASVTEQEQVRRSQIRSALAYPKLLAGIGTCAVVFLMTFMIPRFVDLFGELDQALPAPTLALMSISSALSRTWWIAGVAAGAAALGLRRIEGTPSGRLMVDGWRLRIPVIGPMRRKISVSRFSRTLGTLLRGGVPILEALNVARDVLGNERLAVAVDDSRARVRQGERLAQALQVTGLFPALLIQMIAVGERAGDIGGALDTVASTFEVEVDARMKSSLAMLEPAIILVMGAVVAFVVMAMIWPLFDINPK